MRTPPFRFSPRISFVSRRLARYPSLNLRAAWARAYVRIVGVNRELSWLVFDMLLPVIGLAAYVFYYRALRAPQAFVGMVILGGAMTAYWMNVLWSMASQFYWEKENGNLQLFLMSPMSRMAILLGMALGGGFSTTVRALASLFLGVVVFRIHFTITSLPTLVAVFLLTLIALYGLGMLFASMYMLWGREAWHTSNLLTEPIYLLSGFYFPVRALGFWVAAFASLIPATLGLDGIRQVLLSGRTFGFLSVNVEIAILAVLCLLFLVAAHFMLQLMERIAKREGRLTLRWQ
jgi:ABC-2 type transport system permease protein